MGKSKSSKERPAILKGFKVTNSHRNQTFGIACRTVNELREKSSTKFKIPLESCVFHLDDGTEVDSTDYLLTLPNQTVLICTSKSEPVLRAADIIYNALKTINLHYLRAGDYVSEFLQCDLKEKVRVLNEVLNESSVDTEEPFQMWIKGVETNSKTKESFMERRCQDRIRTYFYKAVSDIRSAKSYSENKRTLEDVVTKMKNMLIKNSYQGLYFNRKKYPECLCDVKGLFQCCGVWSKESCNYNGGLGHQINPYLSRESRIVFSTWNLDHMVERSRSIVPTILKTASRLPSDGKNSECINAEYVYDLLFTKTNLRLVHVVCHDKGAHTSAVCDDDKMICSNKNNVEPLKISLMI